MTKHTTNTIKDVGLLAPKSAEAAQDVAYCKQVLHAGYLAWREEAGFYDYVKKDSPEWREMMAAISVLQARVRRRAEP